MSQPPQIEVEEPQYEISVENKIKHKLPGYTVDILLEQGDIPGAKAELEHLLLEGIHSGLGSEATPEFFSRLESKIHRDHAARKTA